MKKEFHVFSSYIRPITTCLLLNVPSNRCVCLLHKTSIVVSGNSKLNPIKLGLDVRPIHIL